MTTETQIKPETKPDEQTLYGSYLAPVFDLADKVDPESSLPQLAISSALDNPALIPHLAVIADVVMESYLQQLKRLPTDQIISIVVFLHSCSEQQAENEPFVLSNELHLIRPHVDCLTSELVEQIVEELDNSSVFKARPFILYYALSIMQLSMILHGSIVDEDERITLFSDMLVCIDRARASLTEFKRAKEPTHKQIARKGGKQRAEEKYGAAKEYVYKRQQEILAKSPQKTKRQIALILEEEALCHPAFVGMSSDNSFDTIYKWLLKKSVC